MEISENIERLYESLKESCSAYGTEGDPVLDIWHWIGPNAINLMKRDNPSLIHYLYLFFE